MRFRTLFIFILGSLFFLSCGYKVDPTVTYKGSYRSYHKVLKEWTREENVYQPSFDIVMTVSVTWESEIFQDAFLKEKTRAEKLPPGEVNLLKKKYEEEKDQIVPFVLSFYTPKFKWNKLHKDNPSWRIWLVDTNGVQVAPLTIDRMDKVPIAMTKYYPYYDQWSYLYNVRFPRVDNTGHPLSLTGGTVKFLISGVFGSAELRWEVP